jgi:1,4-alpha-glucan branching enzyme
LELILSARHYDPFSFLGLHAVNDDAEHAYVLRTFIAAASKVSVQTGKAWVELKKTHPDGLFEWLGNEAIEMPCKLKVEAGDNTYETFDPYTFESSITQQELYLFGEGRLKQAYKTLGAQFITQDQVEGVRLLYGRLMQNA